MHRYRKRDMVMGFLQNLRQQHGNIFLFDFDLLTRLLINEPDLLADVLSRNTAEQTSKQVLMLKM